MSGQANATILECKPSERTTKNGGQLRAQAHGVNPVFFSVVVLADVLHTSPLAAANDHREKSGIFVLEDIMPSQAAQARANRRLKTYRVLTDDELSKYYHRSAGMFRDRVVALVNDYRALVPQLKAAIRQADKKTHDAIVAELREKQFHLDLYT
jgi:hypothetical protein